MKRRLYLDLGANNGDTIAAELASSRIDFCWGFEPNPQLASKLRQRFKDDPVEIVEAAAWIVEGVRPLYLGHPLSSTLLAGKVALPDYPEFAITYEVSVDVRTVDTAGWLRDHIPDGDAITMKMDIEGAEYEVLQRLLESGEIDRIDELRCEFHPERFPAYSRNHDQLVQAVEARTRLVQWR
ncbi:FkbM family methyltransferase [Pelagibacterium sp. H642]|uniref:FkbM family methyltransferase n=1 Tax=Pelagibacterium sp. H642 TaxID=1881069 RepID=UPI0028163033|nr:FkbM family methyltransferase [Pelagibacterium sp. H642]WMT92605.1 FkbM family methyltransferase [Pelagibacterium sp. H642]